eukprot:12930416-Prorocentrum_lima.AAC.1
MTSSLVGSEMCIRDRLKYTGRSSFGTRGVRTNGGHNLCPYHAGFRYSECRSPKSKNPPVAGCRKPRAQKPRQA